MTSQEIRADMMHEARMCAEYAALGLWDESARRARSYKQLEAQLRAVEPDQPDFSPPYVPKGLQEA